VPLQNYLDQRIKEMEAKMPKEDFEKRKQKLLRLAER